MEEEDHLFRCLGETPPDGEGVAVRRDLEPLELGSPLGDSSRGSRITPPGTQEEEKKGKEPAGRTGLSGSVGHGVILGAGERPAQVDGLDRTAVQGAHRATEDWMGGAGEVRALWIKRAKLGPMDPAQAVEMVAEEGIRGNANQGGYRQVTIIQEEVFDALEEELGPRVDPAMRRANVMVRGIDLRESRGRTLHLGECRIVIRGETVPCERMDQALPGLREALRPEWRGGCFGRVVQGGAVRVGDRAWISQEVAAD